MSELPFYLLAFVVVLGVLIVFHELGHYAAARWAGVKVLRFSVGFGQTIWQRRYGRDGTEWAVAAFPLGGYVKMLDEREAPVANNERDRAFNRQSVGVRSIIVAAGPLANLLLAVLIYWLVFMSGSRELLPVLGEPPASTPAAMAGLRAGEQVVSVNGEGVRTWDEFRWLLLQQAADGATVANLELRNEQGETFWRNLPVDAIQAAGWEGDVMRQLGVVFYRPTLPPVLGRITPDSPAERAGLQSGDRVLTVDGQEVAFWHDFVLLVRDSAENALHVTVDRAGEVLEFSLTPVLVEEAGRSFGRIGAAVDDKGVNVRDLRTVVSYGPGEAALKAVRETWDKSIFSLVMMGRMLTGDVSWRNLSGPVTIADYAGQSARLGLDYYLKFMALVSISLGVLNLLPIPVLDGGHLMYHILEVVRGKPLSERAMEASQRLGMAILITLMAFAFFNDLSRLFSG